MDDNTSQLIEQYYARQAAMAEDMFRQRDAARQASYDAQTGARQEWYDAGNYKLNTAADGALKEAYVGKMMAERNLPQQLAAVGRSGGASESTILALQNAYGANRGQVEQVRHDNLYDLQSQYQQYLAQDKRAYEDSKAADAIARYEVMASLEMQKYNQLLGLAQEANARQTAGGLSDQGTRRLTAKEAINSTNMSRDVNLNDFSSITAYLTKLLEDQLITPGVYASVCEHYKLLYGNMGQ